MARTKKTEENITEEKNIIIKDNSIQDGEVINAVSTKKAKTKPIEETGETVVVCSNYPHDIKYRVPDKTGRMHEFVFHGNAVNLRGKDKGVLPVGAFGITTGVPKDAWEWIKEHRPDDELIKKGYIFASTEADARSAVMERAGMRNGYEPIDPAAGNTTEYSR